MIEVIAAILVNDEGKLLIARRKAGQSLAGYWEFPGGKLEAGEDHQQCLMRELQEELQLDIEVGKYFGESTHSYGENGTIRLIAYYAKILSGTIVLIDHDEFQWVNTEQLGEYIFPPADLDFVEKLISHGISPYEED